MDRGFWLLVAARNHYKEEDSKHVPCEFLELVAAKATIRKRIQSMLEEFLELVAARNS